MKYRSGYKYQLALPEVFELGFYLPKNISGDWYNCNTDGVVVVQPGYAWDGASGPTYDTKAAIYASLCHDVLYQMIRNGDLPMDFRKAADLVFYRMLREKGMWRVRAKVWYWALRWAGRSAALPEAKKPVLEA